MLLAEPRMNELFRALETHSEVDKRKGLVRAIVSTDEVDRYRTTFLPSGCDWKAYSAAGMPILFEHGQSPTRGPLAVANATSIERSTFRGRQCVVVDARFWDNDPFTKALKHAYEEKLQRGWSIRAIPSVQSPPTTEERRAQPELAQCDLIYRKWELLEISTVSVGGNSSCLTQEVFRSGPTRRMRVFRSAAWGNGQIAILGRTPGNRGNGSQSVVGGALGNRAQRSAAELHQAEVLR